MNITKGLHQKINKVFDMGYTKKGNYSFDKPLQIIYQSKSEN